MNTHPLTQHWKLRALAAEARVSGLQILLTLAVMVIAGLTLVIVA